MTLKILWTSPYVIITLSKVEARTKGALFSTFDQDT